MMVDNLLQTNLDLQHPIGRDLLLHPTSRKPRESDRRTHEAGEESSHPTYSRIWNRTSVVAMEPLSIDHNLYLDYRDPRSIKFFNKGRERLPGDPFSGKNIFSWLKRLENGSKH